MEEEILFAEQNGLGIITLNRSKALNALTFNMIKLLQSKLFAWEKDRKIKAVIIKAEEGKAFCAGGDVRALYTLRSSSQEQLDFFTHEYRLNYYIHTFPKPYIALLDGITMGGGVGISLHGGFSVATEHLKFAMPETSIGFFPDVGASYLLNRCPKFMGKFLGLTGKILHAYEAYKLSLVKYLIDSKNILSLIEDLKAMPGKDIFTEVNNCINKYLITDVNNMSLDVLEHEVLINECFAKNSIEEIFLALKEVNHPWFDNVIVELNKKSPLSLKVTLMQLNKTKNLPLNKCLEIDYCLAKKFIHTNDFYEGVRALLIDKDKVPKWQSASLAEVNEQVVDYCFQDNKEVEDKSL